MDARLIPTSSTDLAEALKWTTDAVALLLPARREDWALPAEISALVDEAVAAGDLPLQAGKSLYIHRPAGLKTGRLYLAVVADAGVAKGVKRAAAAIAGLAKAAPVKTLNLAWAGSAALPGDAVEAVVTAFADAQRAGGPGAQDPGSGRAQGCGRSGAHGTGARAGHCRRRRRGARGRQSPRQPLHAHLAG
jgi:leucyl aminopeptidase